MLLDQDRSGAAEVREEGSKTVIIYRLIEREMVALGEVAPIGGQSDCWGAVRRRGCGGASEVEVTSEHGSSRWQPDLLTRFLRVILQS
jgi:hypothetical protein